MPYSKAVTPSSSAMNVRTAEIKMLMSNSLSVDKRQTLTPSAIQAATAAAKNRQLFFNCCAIETTIKRASARNIDRTQLSTKALISLDLA
jgi:hypothetical protein